MGLFDGIVDIFTGGGKSDTDDAYKKAQERLYPYQQGGAEDYQKYRDYVDQMRDKMSKYNDYGDFQHDQINKSPVDYYNQIMQGYMESPQAKYEQEQALRAANAGGSASGMLGSGAYQKALQENAGNISSRDQQRFFGNVMGANEAQMGYLDDARKQQALFNMMQQYLTGLGYGAAEGMSGNDISQGREDARMDRATIDDIASIVGFGGGKSGGGGLFNSGGSGGGGMPDYLFKDAMQNAGSGAVAGLPVPF
jgi:hypothetical protein